MFLYSNDLKYIESILVETGCLSVNQIYRLLRLTDNRKTLESAESVIRQLCYTSHAVKLSEDIIMPLYLERREADPDMLIAVDVMLDLLKDKPKALTSKKPPFKLCFLVGNDAPAFAIAVVHQGKEQAFNTFLESSEDELTVVFLLAELKQVELIKTSQPHYFAIIDNKEPRYFKGA